MAVRSRVLQRRLQRDAMKLRPQCLLSTSAVACAAEDVRAEILRRQQWRPSLLDEAVCPSRFLPPYLLLPFPFILVEFSNTLNFLLANDNESGVLIRRKTLARLEDRDDSSDDTDEELEDVVEISSSDSKVSTAHMESRNDTLRAPHKARQQLLRRGKDALREFKESEDFREEVMAHASMHTWMIVDQWLDGEVGRQYSLDLGEANYGMGYQDAHKEIFGLLKAQDATFSPTNTLGCEILMDNAYLESATNVDSVAGMDRASIPTLTEVGRSDVAATGEEEDPSDALQLYPQCSRSFERSLPTGSSEAGASRVPQL
nr:MAP7 domain-containing protein 1-like [Ipomoea batatas]